MPADSFALVREIGLRPPGVKAATKYDGSPLLKRDGRFLAGLATHPSAEPGTLILRATPADRDLLLTEAPDIYYTTPHYKRHAVVLVRLAKTTPAILADLIQISWRLSATIRFKC